MDETIDERVKRIVADIFNMPYENVLDNSSPKTIDNWDSMQLLNLVLAFEQNFSISLSSEEIDKFIDVKSIVDLIQQKVNKR